MTAEPRTPGYEVSRFEVSAFMRALGLDPREVETLRIHGNRATADLTTGRTIAVHISETRKP